jgi:hypothetical protein
MPSGPNDTFTPTEVNRGALCVCCVINTDRKNITAEAQSSHQKGKQETEATVGELAGQAMPSFFCISSSEIPLVSG